jgi:adenylate kinase family enzyme
VKLERAKQRIFGLELHEGDVIDNLHCSGRRFRKNEEYVKHALSLIEDQTRPVVDGNEKSSIHDIP